MELETREFWVLQDISFQVERGEAFGIIGNNGAGKSTLLKHLSGILHPTRGRLSVKGRLSALIEVGAGFHPDLTGRENIYLYGTILGMTREEIRRKFDAEIQAGNILVVIDAEREQLAVAEPALFRSGATPLPYEQTTALVR